jgi:hypothetical protein
MTGRDLLDRLGDIDPGYIQEAETWTASRPKRGRRLAILLAAALAGLLLVGAGVVTAVTGESIQTWFSYRWENLTGEEAGEGQTALLDHLSQEIGVSDTVEGVTVTVDSATVGEDIFYLLVRVEGLDFSPKHSYGFPSCDVVLSPDPTDAHREPTNHGLAGWGMDYQGIDGDGAALFLFSYDYYAEDILPADGTVDVTLTLENLCQDVQKELYQTVLLPGTWTLSFSLDWNHPQRLALPDTDVTMAVTMWDHSKEETTLTTVSLTNIAISSTGIYFQYDSPDDTVVFSGSVQAVLKNGQTIGENNGTGVQDVETRAWQYIFRWEIPLDLDQVAAVRLGETEIPLP